MEYETAKRTQDALHEAVRDLGLWLNAFPKGAFGLTPDEVKFSPEYKAAKAAYDAKFEQLRNFNAGFYKMFKKEIKAAQRQKIAAGEAMYRDAKCA